MILLTPAMSQAELKLAELTFSKPPAVKLKKQINLNSHAFLSGVGGVAFSVVAKPKGDLHVVSLRYVPGRPDGKRLEVVLAAGKSKGKGKRVKVTPKIYDWELVPIARFAASEYHAAFTLFGDLKNKQKARKLLSKGHKILNYHAAMDNTLLGLRLFQADILILTAAAADLPRDDGAYLLGAGESKPDVRANRRALAALHEYQKTIAKKRFTSYVICDTQQTVEFEVRKGGLALSGAPVWYAWRRKKPKDKAAFNRRTNALANKRLRWEFDRDRSLLSAPEFNKKYSKENRKKRYREIYDAIVTKELVVAMRGYSIKLSRKIIELGGINPAIYGALLKTMRFSAFFRHVKKAKPKRYKAFIESLARVKVRPRVKTPTVMHTPRIP